MVLCLLQRHCLSITAVINITPYNLLPRPPSHLNLQSNLVKQMWQIILLFLFCKWGWRRTKLKGLFSPVRKKQRKDFNLNLPSSKSTAISTMQYIYALSHLAPELQIIIFEWINLKGPRGRTGVRKTITIRKKKVKECQPLNCTVFFLAALFQLIVCNDSRNNILFPNKWLKLKLLQILCRASPWMVGEMHIFSFDYVCSFKLSEREIHFYRNWGTGFALLNNFSGWVPKKKKVRLYQDCPPLWICIDCKVSFILYSWLIDNWWQWMNVWNGGVGPQIHFMELLKNIDVKL